MFIQGHLKSWFVLENFCILSEVKLLLINFKLIKDNKIKLENLIKEIAKSFKYEIHSINFLTNHNPLTIQIIIENQDGNNITLDDCLRFNEPVLSAIDSSNLLNCRYVLEINC